MKTSTLTRLLVTLISIASAGIAQAGLVTINSDSNTNGTFLFGQSMRITRTENQTQTVTRPGFAGGFGSIPDDDSAPRTIPTQILTSRNPLGQTTIATLTGSVTLKRANGPDIIVDAGKGIVLNADGTPATKDGKPITLASLASSDTALTQSLLAAVKEVATSTTSTSLGTLAAIVKVVAEALPSQATTIVQNAVVGLAEGKQITADANTLNTAVGAVIQATSQGSGATVSSLTITASQAAASSGITVNPANTAAALNPVLTPVVQEVITLPASPS